MTTLTTDGARPTDVGTTGGVAFGFCVSHAPQILT